VRADRDIVPRYREFSSLSWVFSWRTYFPKRIR